MELENNKSFIVSLLIVIFIAVALIPTRYAETVSTSENFLIQALRLIKRENLELETYGTGVRAPGFPVIIASGFKLFGVSVESAYYVVRLFYALNIIMVFLLASKLFNPVIGLLSSFFVVSSYAINKASVFLNYDPVISTLILLSIFLFVQQFKGDKLIYSVLSGISLGMAYLVKEIALLYLFLPLIFLFSKKDREYKYIFKSVLFFVFPFLLIISPWLIYMASNGWGFYILGSASPRVLEKFYGQQNPVSFILNKELFRNIYAYYKLYLNPNFVFAPLMVVAWLYIIVITVFKREQSQLILAVCGVLFLPVLIIIGGYGERIGQAITFFDLSFIALSYFIVSFSLFVYKRLLNLNVNLMKRNALFIAGITFFILIVSGIVFHEEMNKHISNIAMRMNLGFYKETHTFYIDNRFEVRGRLNDDVKKACEWINTNVRKGEIVYVDGAIWETFHFYTKMDFKRKKIPRYGVNFNVSTGMQKNLGAVQDRIIGIWPSLKFRSVFGRDRYVEALFEGDIMRIFETIKEHPLILSQRNNFIGYYLDMIGGLVVYENNQIRIYKGVNNANIKNINQMLKFHASDLFMDFLPWLIKYYHEDYGRFESFLNKYALTKEKIMENTYKKYQQKWVLKHIPRDAKISFSSNDGEFITEGFRTTHFDKEHPLSYFEQRYDFLFLHNNRKRDGWFPGVFSELKGREAMIKFPYLPYLGDGWEVYRLGRK